MYELKMAGVPLPKCMVCESRADVEKARECGWPFLVKPKGWTDEKLVGAVMFHFLQRKFPHIKWTQVLGLNNSRVNTIVVNVPNDGYTERETVHDFEAPDELESMEGLVDYRELQDDYVVGSDADSIEVPDRPLKEVGMDEFFRDAVEYIDMDKLQDLGLLPEFLADITEAIKRNLIGTAWMDGWNKKLQTAVGDYRYSEAAPNLMILDVSGSIPTGVAYSMVTLIDLLRSKANADLIITSWSSRWFGRDEELPSPEILASMVGGANEATQFNKILVEHVLGRHWGNVICFGDMHAPEDQRFQFKYQVPGELHRNTQVDRILCYDTRGDKVPGYVAWAVPHAGQIQTTDGSWCKCFRR